MFKEVDKQSTLNKEKSLSCIYCLGPLIRMAAKSVYFINLKCLECGRTQMIYKTDFRSFLNWEGDY